jgi:hypothetical protein
MVHESMKNLEFDRRLEGRRGWISDGELEAHLEKLPDSSSKAEVVADGSPAQSGGDAPAAPTAGS